MQEIDIKGLPFALSDAVVCFTGIRDNDLENIIKSKGGKIVSSVTKACNYLIYSSDDSVKYRQAKERNILQNFIPRLKSVSANNILYNKRMLKKVHSLTFSLKEAENIEV